VNGYEANHAVFAGSHVGRVLILYSGNTNWASATRGESWSPGGRVKSTVKLSNRSCDRGSGKGKSFDSVTPALPSGEYTRPSNKVRSAKRSKFIPSSKPERGIDAGGGKVELGDHQD